VIDGGIKIKKENVMESKRNLFVYYLRDENNAPVVTVTLKRNGDEFARGLAICSFRETPSKALGRIKSYVRADKALRNKENDDDIFRFDANYVISNVQNTFDLPFVYKSQYIKKEDLTTFEKKLFGFDRKE
jgi:hypothetical protein